MTQNFEPIGVRLSVEGSAQYIANLKAAQAQAEAFAKGTGLAFKQSDIAAQAYSRTLQQLLSTGMRVPGGNLSSITPAGLGGMGAGLPPRPPRAPGTPLFAGGDFDEAIRKNNELTKQLARGHQESAKSAQQLTRSIREQQAAFTGLNPHMAASIFYTQQVGAGFITLRGAAGLAALGIATLIQELIAVGRTAVEFESQMAQVQQVTGLGDRVFKLLTEDIRQMSRELPFTTEEIGKVVTEASRAGVEGSANLRAFAKAMLDFGTISNITAEQATLDFAHLTLALQHPKSRVDQLTSSVAALDKELPTSSREIVNFSLRIAAAGTVTKFSAGQIFGIAAAMTSLGIQAEAGGTAVQRVMFAMAAAVRENGEELRKFARVAGVSSEEFAATWRDRPAEAFTQFVEGLGRAGDQAQIVLKGLELGDVRLIRVFATTAGAGDLLRRSIELGAEAIANNTLAAERAAIVYATTESQVKRLENAFRDNAIEIGTSLLPAYRDFLRLITSSIMPAMDAFAKSMANDAIPQVLAVARAVSGQLDPSLDGATQSAKDLSDAIREIGISVVSVGGGTISWAQEFADRIHQAHLFAVILNSTIRAQNLESLARQTRDASKRAEIEREAQGFRDKAKTTAQQIADIDARIADTGQRRSNWERDITRSRQAQLALSQREASIRGQAAKFASLDLGQTQAQIAVIKQNIASYEAQVDALRKYGASSDLTQGSVAELTAEINLQRSVLEHLTQQEEDLINTARQFPPPPPPRWSA